MKSFWHHLFLDNGDITLIEAGTQKYMPNQINDYTVKHHYVLHLILSGKGTYQVEQETYHLEANDSFILKKNQAVHYEPDPDNPWTICWIGLGGSHIDTYLEQTSLYTQYVHHFETNSMVYSQMIALIKFLSQFNPNDFAQKTLTFGYLYTLLSAINTELAIQDNFTDPLDIHELTLAEKIYNYISEHFNQNLTVESIAHYFDISRNYLFKVCKSFYGQSPKQILLEIRMNQAAQLLRSSRKKVNEIAYYVGYKDAFLFSKMFKNYYGHSPSQFRFLSDEAIDEALFIREKFFPKNPLDHLK